MDLNYLNDTLKNNKIIEEYSPNKNRKLLIVFGDMIADMLSKKRLNPIVTGLFLEEEN